MNRHLEQWLDAYLDGELDAIQARQAEAHLESCPACRAELEQRRALSPLLREEPPVEGSKSEQRFVAEVGLRLQRNPAVRRETARPSAVVWGMIPIVLTLVWAFIQTAFFVSGVVESIPGAADAVAQDLSAGIPQLAMPEIIRDGIGWLGTPGWSGWSAIGLWITLLVVSLLFTGWFAGWWISLRASGSHNGR
ncbi:MAG: zf-HC2 domain-containing protein [Anaerolineales bacterium]